MVAILGINDSHTATACVLVDGKIAACASEERFSRVKSQAGFPFRAIPRVLRQAGLGPEDLDLVVFNWYNFLTSTLLDSSTGISPSNPGGEDAEMAGRFRLYERLRRAAGFPSELLYYLPRATGWMERLNAVQRPLSVRLTRKERLRFLEKVTTVPEKKVVTIHHHLAHAYAAWHGTPQKQAPVLVLTLDGYGDEVCASVNVGQDGEFRCLAMTPKYASLGFFYKDVTRLLGMKPMEHEYKVMGLAPYAPPEGVQRSYEAMKDLVRLGLRNPLVFEAQVPMTEAYRCLRVRLEGHRFDWIAGGAQRLLEERVVEWVLAAIRETGIHSVALGGGVFMNVKLNMRIAAMEEVERLFIFPSCGDESNAIGGAYWGAHALGEGGRIPPMGPTYFGPDIPVSEIEDTLRREDGKTSFEVLDEGALPSAITDLLMKGEIVGRVAGPMEYGARALGNRSILADPSNLEVIKKINASIKHRDFWMPFAPSLLEERHHEYVMNPKRLAAPYMMLAFDSTAKGAADFRAAIHPYDLSLRPQVLAPGWNDAYRDILRKFESKTGIPGILNTSFNIHGDPIVCSAHDALDTFARSGLDYLALGPYLLHKAPAVS